MNNELINDLNQLYYITQNASSYRTLFDLSVALNTTLYNIISKTDQLKYDDFMKVKDQVTSAISCSRFCSIYCYGIYNKTPLMSNVVVSFFKQLEYIVGNSDNILLNCDNRMFDDINHELKMYQYTMEDELQKILSNLNYKASNSSIQPVLDDLATTIGYEAMRSLIIDNREEFTYEMLNQLDNTEVIYLLDIDIMDNNINLYNQVDNYLTSAINLVYLLVCSSYEHNIPIDYLTIRIHLNKLADRCYEEIIKYNATQSLVNYENKRMFIADFSDTIFNLSMECLLYLIVDKLANANLFQHPMKKDGDIIKFKQIILTYIVLATRGGI